MNTKPSHRPLTPDLYERALAAGSILLLAAIIVALFKGRGEWGLIPVAIWFHLATIAVALVLTPVMLLRRRGDQRHRVMGWAWSGAMFLTALLSLLIRQINHGGFSVIHILSIVTLATVPLIILTARRHNVVRHRRAVRGMVTGALLVSGLFTFQFGRLLGHWLFG